MNATQEDILKYLADRIYYRAEYEASIWGRDKIGGHTTSDIYSFVEQIMDELIDVSVERLNNENN